MRWLSGGAEPPLPAPAEPAAPVSPAESAASPGEPLLLQAPHAPAGEAEPDAATGAHWPASAFQLLAAAVLRAQPAQVVGSANAALLRRCAALLGVSEPLREHLLERTLPAWLASQPAERGAEVELPLRLAWSLLAAEEGEGAAAPESWRAAHRRSLLAQLALALPPRSRASASRVRDAQRALEPGGARLGRELRRLRPALDAAGWAAPPLLQLRLYSALCAGLWAELAADAEGPDGERRADQTLAALRCAWPALGVSPLAHAGHAVFGPLSAWAAGGGGEAALEAARRAAAEGAFGAEAEAEADVTEERPGAEETHLRGTLGAVCARCALALSDYHSAFPNGADWVMEAMVDIARDASALLAAARLPPPSAAAPPLAQLLACSLAAEYGRCAGELQPLGPSDDGASMAALSRRAAQLLDAELELFAPSLEESEPRASCFAAAALQACLERSLRAWLDPPATPGGARPRARALEEALPALRAAEGFVAYAQSRAVAASEGEPPPPLLVAALAGPLAQAWVDERLAALRACCERAAAAEGGPAAPPLSPLPSPAPAAVDLLSFAHEAVDAFFGMGLTQLAPAQQLAAGLSAEVGLFADRIAADLGDPGRFAPRRRARRARYKPSTAALLARLDAMLARPSGAAQGGAWAASAAAAAAAVAGSLAGGPGAAGAGGGGEAAQAVAARLSAALRRSGCAAPAAGGLGSDLGRFLGAHATLHFLAEELRGLEAAMEAGWRAAAGSRAPGQLRWGAAAAPPGQPLFPAFAAAAAQVAAAEAAALELLASTLVFVRLHDSFVAGAYVATLPPTAPALPPRRSATPPGEAPPPPAPPPPPPPPPLPRACAAARGRLPLALLTPLAPLLARLCDALPSDESRRAAAAATLRCVVAGLTWVLLDGGLSRIFQQDDAEAIAADLEEVRCFFVAGGEGLGAEETEALLAPARALVAAMALDTHALIGRYEGRVAEHTSATMRAIVMRPMGFSFGLDALGGAPEAACEAGAEAEVEAKEEAELGEDELLCILCHRGDLTAAAYLKGRNVPRACSGSQDWLLARFLDVREGLIGV